MKKIQKNLCTLTSQQLLSHLSIHTKMDGNIQHHPQHPLLQTASVLSSPQEEHSKGVKEADLSANLEVQLQNHTLGRGLLHLILDSEFLKRQMIMMNRIIIFRVMKIINAIQEKPKAHMNVQGFPFENFGGGGARFPPPRLGKSVGGGNIRRFLAGGRHNFTNLMGKNT